MTTFKTIHPWLKVAALIVGLLLIVGLGFRAIADLADYEAARARDAWQTRLSIVANSRAAAVSEWVGEQLSLVQSLAENPSLQLYALDLADSSSQENQRQRASQAAYVRALLTAAASRGGFDKPSRGPDLPANVKRSGLAGLALADAQGRVLAATQGLPEPTSEFQQFLKRARGLRGHFYDMQRGEAGVPVIGVVSAIYAPQTDPHETAPVGFVFGLKYVDADLFDRLQQPGDHTATGETYLVRQRDRVIEYLSPLSGGYAPLSLSVPLDQADTVAVKSVTFPGSILDGINYRAEPVLFASRLIEQTGWTLLRSVDRSEALGPADASGRRLLIWLVLGLVALSALIALIWRHGASLRVARALDQARRSADDFQRISRFLEVVTDLQGATIATFDADGRYTFANSYAAEEAGMEKADMLGKKISDVLGSARAAPLADLGRQALAEDKVIKQILSINDSEDGRTVRSSHIPLSDQAPGDAAVLMVQEDITALVRERAEREGNLRALISALVGIVDRRDPYSALHSARVAQVAESIASEMEVSVQEIEAARTAGMLMNLGKILVPRDLLLKTDPLSEDELHQIRSAILSGAELLEGIKFDGPVVESIRQIQERWDGNGIPNGLADDQILLTARIVCVANAFVGMISPRAYREAIDIDSAVGTLLTAVGEIYDRAVIAALVNILDNRGGRELWTGFGLPPKDKDI